MASYPLQETAQSAMTTPFLSSEPQGLPTASEQTSKPFIQLRGLSDVWPGLHPQSWFKIFKFTHICDVRGLFLPPLPRIRVCRCQALQGNTPSLSSVSEACQLLQAPHTRCPTILSLTFFISDLPHKIYIFKNPFPFSELLPKIICREHHFSNFWWL